MAALANPTVMLMELRLLRIQLVPVKIMPITDATVAPQVKGIDIALYLIHMFLHCITIAVLKAPGLTGILWKYQKICLLPLSMAHKAR